MATYNDEPTVEEFVLWLERRGATFQFRHNGTTATTDWQLDLNGVPGMSRAEAEEISVAAFQIRDAIRAVLVGRHKAARRRERIVH